MADNWEDRLAPVVLSPNAPAPKNWEERLKGHDFSTPPNPADSGNTLQVFNPFGKNFDTGINIGATTQNALAGAGKSMTDLARGVGQKFGAYSFKDAADQKRLDAPLMETTAGKVGNIGGSVATMLPAAFIPGVNGLAGASAIGALTGFAQPATGFGDMAMNTGIGGAAGVAGNVVGRTIGAGAGLLKSTVQPFFQRGRQAMVDDLIQKFTPNPSTALQNIANDAGEIVPGSLPNAAEAAQTPGLAQLVKQVQQSPGTQAQADFLARQQANNAARVAAVRTVAGDPGQRAFFAAERDATADQLYGAARATGIDPSKLTPDALKNIATFQARVPESVQNLARQIAAVKGAPMTDATSLDGMHWTKVALDGLISKEAGPGGNSALLSAYTGLKNDLVKGMGELSPDYDAARQTFQAMSKPINQMDVGQALSDKLIPALNDFGANGNLRAAGYAQALRSGDQTAQRVLGMPSATIGDVLGDTHMNTLNALGQDLARSSNASSLAAARGSDTVQNAISQNIIKSTLGPLGLPPSLSGNTLLQSILRPAQFAGGLAEPQVMDQLGATLLSPQMTAASLSRAGSPKALDAVTQGLLRYGAPVGAGAATGLLAPLSYADYLQKYDEAPDWATKKAIGDQYQQSLLVNPSQQ